MLIKCLETDMDIREAQIRNQLTGTTLVDVFFPDDGKTTIALVEQNGITWIQPAYCLAKRINNAMYDDLKGQFTGQQEFNTDPEVIISDMGYDEFFHKYYNNLPEGE